MPDLLPSGLPYPVHGKRHRHDGEDGSGTVGFADVTGTVGTTQIADGAVTNPKLATNAVTSDKIAAGQLLALDFESFAANAVLAGPTIGVPATPTARALVGADIPNASITDAKLAQAWTTWSPTVTQSGTVTCAITGARYLRLGTLLHAWCKLVVSGAGTAANPVIIGALPVAVANYAAGMVIGQGYLYDASTTIYYVGCCSTASTTSVYYIISGQTNVWGIAPNLALAASDQLVAHLTYEVA